MRDSNVVSAEERYDPFRFGVKKLILIMSRFIVVHLLDDETKQDRERGKQCTSSTRRQAGRLRMLNDETTYAGCIRCPSYAAASAASAASAAAAYCRSPRTLYRRIEIQHRRGAAHLRRHRRQTCSRLVHLSVDTVAVFSVVTRCNSGAVHQIYACMATAVDALLSSEQARYSMEDGRTWKTLRVHDSIGVQS